MAEGEQISSRTHHDLDLTPFRCKFQASSSKIVQLEFRVPEESRKKDCSTNPEDDISFIDQRSGMLGKSEEEPENEDSNEYEVP
eukprot:8033470-Karenia_brevis.AAC.1